MDIIVLLIIGAIIGLLGKFVAPGDRDNIPIWLTVICGIGGVLLGYVVVGMFGSDDATASGTSEGIDWIRWIVSIVIAAVLVMIASAVTGRSSGRTRV